MADVVGAGGVSSKVALVKGKDERFAGYSVDTNVANAPSVAVRATRVRLTADYGIVAASSWTQCRTTAARVVAAAAAAAPSIGPAGLLTLAAAYVGCPPASCDLAVLAARALCDVVGLITSDDVADRALPCVPFVSPSTAAAAVAKVGRGTVVVVSAGSVDLKVVPRFARHVVRVVRPQQHQQERDHHQDQHQQDPRDPSTDGDAQGLPMYVSGSEGVPVVAVVGGVMSLVANLGISGRISSSIWRTVVRAVAVRDEGEGAWPPWVLASVAAALPGAPLPLSEIRIAGAAVDAALARALMGSCLSSDRRESVSGAVGEGALPTAGPADAEERRQATELVMGIRALRPDSLAPSNDLAEVVAKLGVVPRHH